MLAGTLIYDVLAFPVIMALAVFYGRAGGWWVIGIVLPLLIVRQLYKQNAALEKVTEELLQLMVAVTEAHDLYTSGHSRRVAAYSRIIARSARMSEHTIERIGIAALLHDVGKIYEVFLPILRKPGKLTPEEWAVMKTHPIKSEALVSKVTQLRDLAPAVRAHHERWDGKGYPDGLLNVSIPLGARVIALADTIDAMNSSRPYRDRLDVSFIRDELERGRGTQFDPALVDAVLTDKEWARLQQAIRRFSAIPAEGGALAAEDEITAVERGVELRVTRSA
jgi:HD-GYP domain-containing protein (c-di-GMP phosphodiesterase class II)